MKYLYNAIILLCIFAGSVYYFSRDMKEEVFDYDKTIEMSAASFPTITLRLEEDEINLLHGYSSNLDANNLRECLTPIDETQSFVVAIDEKENEVKRVVYELRSVYDNKLIETDTINALEKEGNVKTAKIKFKTELEEDLEYAVEITLVTSESRKMNYYTRIKLLPNSYVDKKLDFAMDFHNSIMDKNKAEEIIIYLEPNKNTDNTTLSYVNIHSSFDLIRWGNLEPRLISEIIPSIKEIDRDLASIELKYIITAETDYGLEKYYVNEYYRVRYTNARMYLLNYERTMESVFDINLTSLSKSEFKIGITNNTELDLVTSADDNKLSFVRNRELWYYNLAENAAVKVFSFAENDTYNVRDIYDEHDVRILNMDDDGNIDFMVYGYMNRGVYEGRVGIVLYKFYSSENRIEELVYIPIDVPFQILKEELHNFSYVNQYEIYYFMLNHNIYSFNLITKGLSVIAKDIGQGHFVVSNELHYIAWQSSSDPYNSPSIVILDLETGEEFKITAPTDSEIKLLSQIDNNIIYGYYNADEIAMGINGNLILPLYKVEISDSQRKILKEYSKEGFYITGTTVDKNVITLERMIKIKGNGDFHYELSDSDNILNRITEVIRPIGLTTRVTDRTLTEYYISLPSGFSMESKPSVNNTINTIITEDTTLRIEDEDMVLDSYIVYALGKVQGMYDKAGDAINQANATIGVVLDKSQRVIWERSIKQSISEIPNVNHIYASSSKTSIYASVQMLLNYHGKNTDFNNTNQRSSVYELLYEKLEDSFLNLTGCSLEELFYYIDKDKPVIAMKDATNAVLIIGYDAYNIIVIDPSLHKSMKIGYKDSVQMFSEAGNIFFSYLDDNYK
jgi:hypothetical protein